jgi:hypothetical protein
VTVNYNNDPSDMYYNIFLDPMFVNAAGGNYSLQASSPAIDAGNPGSPYDPDNTIADQGAFYYDQSSGTSIVIELTPHSTPVVIPPEGGNIDFGVYLENVSASAQDFDAWIDIAYEGGSPTTVIQRGFSNYLPGWAINRPNTFFPVPSSYAAGNYTFTGKVGNHPNDVWDESGFPFEKTGGAGLSGLSGFTPFLVDGAPNPFGQSDLDIALAPSKYELLGNYPNPFNPTTSISYRLPESSLVNLKVYDASGRLVADLVNQNQAAGTHEIEFDASHLSSGVYLYLLNTGNFQTSGKMVLMK